MSVSSDPSSANVIAADLHSLARHHVATVVGEHRADAVMKEFLDEGGMRRVTTTADLCAFAEALVHRGGELTEAASRIVLHAAGASRR